MEGTFTLKPTYIECPEIGDINFSMRSSVGLKEGETFTEMEVFDDHIIVKSSTRKWKVERCPKVGCTWWIKEFI